MAISIKNCRKPLKNDKILSIISNCIKFLKNRKFKINKSDFKFYQIDCDDMYAEIHIKESENGKYILVLNENIFNDSNEEIENTIYHELCHYLTFEYMFKNKIMFFTKGMTSYCGNYDYFHKRNYYSSHGIIWKRFAKEIGKLTNQEITRVGKPFKNGK